MPNVYQILAAGTEAAHGAATEGGIVDRLVHDFGFDFPSLIAQIISFSVVAFILYKAAFKPVLSTIDERQTKIEDGLKYAEDMKAKLADAESQHKEILAKASTDAGKLVEEARQLADEKIAKSTQEAAAQAGDILKKAEQQIELDRKQMIAEARSEIARLVVATAGKVLAKDLSTDEKSKFTESASASLLNSSN